MIKAIIFDADGVVIQKEKYFSERLSEEYGIGIEKILPFFKNEFKLCMVGKADLKEELKKYVNDWGWQKSIEEMLTCWFEGERSFDKRMMNFIINAKNDGLACYMATNNEKYRVEYLRKELELDKYFSKVFDSASLGYVKEQSEFWQKVCDNIGPQFGKEEILVIDDDLDNVQTAEEFGLNTHLFSSFDEFKKANLLN